MKKTVSVTYAVGVPGSSHHHRQRGVAVTDVRAGGWGLVERLRTQPGAREDLGRRGGERAREPSQLLPKPPPPDLRGGSERLEHVVLGRTGGVIPPVPGTGVRGMGTHGGFGCSTGFPPWTQQ